MSVVKKQGDGSGLMLLAEAALWEENGRIQNSDPNSLALTWSALG